MPALPPRRKPDETNKILTARYSAAPPKPKIVAVPAPRLGAGAPPRPAAPTTSLRGINAMPAKPATSLRGVNVMPTTPVSRALTYKAGGFNAQQMQYRSFNPQEWGPGMPGNMSWQAQPPVHAGDLGNQYLQGGRGFYIPWQGGSKNTLTGAIFNPPTLPNDDDFGLGGGGDGGGGGGGGGGGPRGDYFSLGLINWRI